MNSWDSKQACEYCINQSRFISYLYQVNSIDEINNIIVDLKQLHKKATHICYSYKFFDKLEQKMCIKAYDDHEPKMTAGYPILKIIETKQLSNILVVVVRYFGKSKLGASLLYRSYLKSASLIVNKYLQQEK